MINEVLDLSKIEANRLDINLNDFILQDLMKIIIDSIVPYTKINKNILKFKIPEKSISLFSDEMKLKQVLFNLLTNACKYSENSEVHISITEQKINKVDCIKIIVKDKGIGIAKEELADIFDPFTRVNKEKNINVTENFLCMF